MATTTTTGTDVEPALYCGTYGKYNDGSIAGKWLKLRDYPDAEAFLQACRELHRDEDDPEFMFQDCEGFPEELYGESLSLDDLSKLYEWVYLADEDREVVGEYLEATGYKLDDVNIADIQDKLYILLDLEPGMSNDAAMGWYMIDQGLVEVPEHLRGYIDVEALGRDSLMDFSVSGNGYVFEA
jgi:antirestriction protein